MSTKLHIVGDYEEKIVIFGHVIAHHKGNFDLTKEVGATGWSQTFGPLTIHESVDNGKVKVTASAFGVTKTIYRTGVTGSKSFKIEIDRRNFVKGKIEVLP